MNHYRTIFAVAAIFIAAGVLCPPAHGGTLGTEVIGMFPQNVGEFAYADLRQARALPWFPQLKQQMLPPRFQQFEQFLTAAGLNPDMEVEELAWGLVPGGLPSGAASSTAVPTSEEIVGVALGSFRPETAEAYFKAQKLPVVKVRDFSLYPFGGGGGSGDLFFVFIDANTAAFGQRAQLERMIAVRYGEERSLFDNPELSQLVASANGSGVVWTVMSAAYARLAMQQLAPELGQFPQAQQLVAKLRALSIEITAGTGVEAHFNAVCATPDDANTFAALLMAGLLYKRFQVGNSNPDLATMLDGMRIAPAGDTLQLSLSLTNDQVVGLIHHNTFGTGL
jgi:hypothetical protein